MKHEYCDALAVRDCPSHLAEPEYSVLAFRIDLVLNLNMQALVNRDRVWFVPGITRHCSMAHLHQLNLLQLRQFLWVGRTFLGGWFRGQ